MELTKINGNSYYINAPTNVGVYTFKNKNCILIDTGTGNTYARKIEKILEENSLHPKYIINTHCHFDHCGGNTYFQENYPGSLVYASPKERMLMEYPEVQGAILFCSHPIKKIQKSMPPFKVDYTLEEGVTKINDEKFTIIYLEGHSPQCIGILTRDKVCFVGDAIFSHDILDKYSFPYLYNIEDSINTLNKLKEVDAEYFVISHSTKILNKEDFLKLIDVNLKNIDNYKNQILELLEQPLSRESLMENLTILNDLSVNFKQYHLNFASLSGFLSYLCEKGLIDVSVEDGNVYYFKKE